MKFLIMVNILIILLYIQIASFELQIFHVIKLLKILFQITNLFFPFDIKNKSSKHNYFHS